MAFQALIGMIRHLVYWTDYGIDRQYHKLDEYSWAKHGPGRIEALFISRHDVRRLNIYA